MRGTRRLYNRAMELLAWFWDLVVHLDEHLAAFVAQHGVWVYGLLFAIVFCETGLIVTPFLPGDSLLFVAGAVAAAGDMNIAAVMATLIARGAVRRQRQLRGRPLARPAGVPLREVALVQPGAPASARTPSTRSTAARPSSSRASCRSCAPTFPSSPASAPCPTCATWPSASSAPASGWSRCASPGYWFGNQPVVKNNLTVVILVIVAISVSPGVFAWLRSRRAVS